MERKLVSLPSFFVLLLVAGIAFLATPVVDVHAAAPVVAAAGEVIDPSGSAAVPTTTGAAITTAGETQVIVIKFTQATAVKVTNPPTVSAADGFGPEDLLVTVTNTAPGARETGRTNNAYFLLPADISITPLAAGAKVPGDGTNTAPATPTTGSKWFVVSVDVPANGTGTITVQVAAAVVNGSSFEDTAGDDYAGTGNLPSSANAVNYNTYNPAPTVKVNWTAGTPTDRNPSSNASPFQVTFAIEDTVNFASAPTFGAASITVVNGRVNSVGPVTKTNTDNTQAYSVNAYITPNPNVAHVVVGVAKDAVTDAAGAKSAAVPTTLDANGRANDNALKVTVDTVVPVVMISTTETRPDLSKPASKDNVVTSIAVTFNIQEDPDGAGTMPAATILDADLSNKLTMGTTAAEQDITVTGGTLSGFAMSPAQYHATYTATITPAATAEKVDIVVKAGAVADLAENSSVRVVHPSIVTGYDGSTPPAAVSEFGTATTKGFSIALSVPSKSFVVLAKSAKVADSGISGLKLRPNNTRGADSTEKIIDIKDDVWQDLSTFMGVGPGGAIDLLAATGTATDEDLVISEIMWGSDQGLGTTPEARANSQWIELYNTTANTITGEWELMFTKSATGLGITDARLSDKFTNFGLTQSNQFWAISDTDGGAYGQGGRTSSAAANPGALRRLVSMERKIDFVKVEKTHNANDAAKNRTTQLEGVPAGDLAGSWQASKDPQGANLSGRRLGTPGAKPFVTVSTTSISKAVVFNEVANRAEDKNDWIELYNPGGSDVKINGWVLSKVTKVGTDEVLFKFESDENIVVPAKKFLLVVNEDPSETSLAAGENIDNPGSKANGLPTKFYINDKLKIPEKDYLLILRTEDKKGTDEKIVDIAGNIGAMDLSDSGFRTALWPLKAWNAIKTDDLAQNNDKTWVRDKGKNLDHGDAWKPDGGVTGLGIDRAATSRHSGTPGFDNGAVKDKVKDLTASDPVVISEIMFGTGPNNRVPQWIELFNPSKTQAVKLHNWKLEVRNTNDASEELNVELSYTLTLPDVRVLPKQTVLIVSSSIGESTRNRFPSDRVINLWSNRSFRGITEATSPRDPVLSSVGFYMKLSDPDKVKVDEVGNIDGARRSDDTPNWTLPGGNLEEGGRSSMIRREATFGDGTQKDSWISAAATDGVRVGTDELYYGDEDDIGTPGYRAGGPLPVQLSSFYSKRNDAGAVVITWSTESELDNAGFNLLRSSSRSGEFTKINAQLIPGAGTTGEKNTYTWTDTGAHPNVVYYYQIEDVSLDGAHRTLRTTRLRGHVGAHGKLTTTWGVLKSRD